MKSIKGEYNGECNRTACDSGILPSVKLKRGVYASIRTEPKLSRNSLCSCDSGKKYKKCCLNK